MKSLLFSVKLVLIKMVSCEKHKYNPTTSDTVKRNHFLQFSSFFIII
uniref:Lipoprotein n=1 Tax=Anguilla anguilla TaxID=7936 RepID=A0A0E9U2Z0_ANGAN